MRDLLVAGGGPVGLVTALYAARVGLDVEVWEPRTASIDKACGEGLMPSAVTGLASLGIDPAGHDLRGIRYVSPGSAATADFRHGVGRGVRRTVLHAAVHEAVLAAGVPVVERALRRVGQDEGGVVADGERFRYLVAADGLRSPVRRQLGLGVAGRGGRRYGLRRHFRARPWTSYVEVHWSPSCEAYVTPLGKDLVGVALLTRERGSFDEQFACFPALVERVGDSGLDGIRGAGPLRQRTRRRVAGRILLVGDASGYVDALTGEGIALGMAQARAAVSALASGTPESYERAWRRITFRHRALTTGLLSSTRVPWVRRAVVPAASRLPRVFSAAVNELARPA